MMKDITANLQEMILPGRHRAPAGSAAEARRSAESPASAPRSEATKPRFTAPSIWGFAWRGLIEIAFFSREFLEFHEADPGFPEVEDAKKGLAGLKAQ